MKYAMRRVILFTHNFAAMRDFYSDTFGLEIVEEDDGWADMAAEGCNIAIHAAGTKVTIGPDFEGPHKIVFHADDVHEARADVIARGVAIGEVQVFGDLRLCDGSDPDGNRFQFSNRP
ncbi:VOC family protein [Sphingomonas sp.]|jgi:catechol 2,3-dioxygenase-like lactoylglutathione lyase family enzyme|uniref:VOC family protein n=1 Tax=Sphingomonas sp. TaxID=28214 RepID=UPI002E2ED655|nr:VOC family protein [Sphingomonas sp.]HEX4693211.1 VOC family protein [Sphingomonas sp.]